MNNIFKNFDLDINLIDFDKFEKMINFEDFSKGSKIASNYDKIYKYLNIHYSKDDSIDMLFSPTYQKGINKPGSPYFCMEILMPDKDRVLLLYKRTMIHKVKFIKLYDIPFSLNKNEENVIKILNLLKELRFFRFEFKEKYLDYYKELNLTESLYVRDFYIKVDEYLERLDNKWLKNNRVKRYTSDENFRVEYSNSLDYNKLVELHDTWAKDMNIEVVQNKDFYNFAQYKSDNILWVALYYKDKLISAEAYEIFNNKLIDFYFVHLGRQKREELKDDYLYTSLGNVTYVSLYYTLTWAKSKGVDYIFWQGSIPGNNSLLKFKEKSTDGYIKYYISEYKKV